MRPQFGKDKIVQAAVQLFVEHGFHTTSTSQIAEAANVSKGLMYNYFKSKDSLLLAIIDQASQDMFDVASNMSGDGGYQKILRVFLDQYGLMLKTKKLSLLSNGLTFSA